MYSPLNAALLCGVGMLLATGITAHEHFHSAHESSAQVDMHATKWGPWPGVASMSQTNLIHRKFFVDIDLSGIWSSPVAPTHRYLFFRSGGGYGTGKDSHAAFPHMPVHEPGTAYDVKCLTSDFRGGKPGGCGWDKAVCTLAAGTDGKSPVATCAFDNGATLPGAVSADGCSINMSAPWTKFCGSLSGLWSGPKENADYYVLTHDKATDAVTVWWDTAITASGWTWGNGTFDPKSNNMSFVLANYGTNPCGGTVDATMSQVTAGCLVGWHKQPTQMLPSEIHTVHLVFMNHLDVGYASFINNIDNEYFHGYFPKAKLLADQMRALEGTDRFIYVTHPWLMSFFLDCPCTDSNDPNCSALSLNNPYAPPLQCPTPEEVQNFTAALKKGDIVWHAAPFNVQAENMGGALFEAGIKQFQAFDKQFYGENRTITMSDRDVIYVTRSVIPLLAKYGIQGLTIGSNGANYPPQVPKLHVWRDPVSGEEVIVAYHPYGYGGYSKSTCAGPGQCGDCAEAPNGVALCTEFRTDNSGPPASTDEVIASLDAVRAEYPKASVFASTFDNFIRDVLPIKDQLPVVTKEVGDTWMYGAPSDPLKMAQNREIQRAWEECLATGDAACDYSNPAIQNMTRFLMKAPEHTWGIPGISGWGGGDSYEKRKFMTLLNTTGFLHAAATWAEQRVYNELAIKALEHAQHPLAASVRARVDALSNVVQPDLSAYTKEPTLATVVTIAGVAIGFDGTRGEIVTLTNTRGGREVSWASTTNSLGGFAYHTLNESDWKPFTYDYINGHSESGGFCKPGSNNYSESVWFRPTMTGLFTNSQTRSVVAQMAMPATSTKHGAPTDLFLNVTIADGSDTAPLVASFELTWLGKQQTMIGEETMLMFKPLGPLPNGSAWSMDKLGTPVDPEDVIDGGNQFNHGVWFNGVTARAGPGSYNIVPYDSPNMNPITSSFPYGNGLPAGSDGLVQLAKGSVTGMSANLHNNLWNTNYPLFYPYFDPQYCASPTEPCPRLQNSKFRFKLTLTEKAN